jgi:hypothetical protein
LWLFRTPRHQADRTSRPGAREQHADDRHREIAFLAGEARRDHGAERRRGDDAGQDDHRDHQREQGANGTRHAVGFARLAAREERRVHRNERRRQRPFAEQVLEEVGDAETGGEGVAASLCRPK